MPWRAPGMGSGNAEASPRMEWDGSLSRERCIVQQVVDTVNKQVKAKFTSNG
jgi:hypothetical protein